MKCDRHVGLMCVWNVDSSELYFINLFPINDSIFVGENDKLLMNGGKPIFLIESPGDALCAFINEEYQGYLLSLSNNLILLL